MNDGVPETGPIPRIGRCMACRRMARIDRGVCGGCLPRMTPAFAAMALRVRTDPSLALRVHGRFEEEEQRAAFAWIIGYDPMTAAVAREAGGGAKGDAQEGCQD